MYITLDLNYLNHFLQEIGFIDFLINQAPGCILAMIPSLGVLLLVFRKELGGQMDNYPLVLHKCQKYRIKDWRLLAQSGWVFSGGSGRASAAVCYTSCALVFRRGSWTFGGGKGRRGCSAKTVPADVRHDQGGLLAASAI